MTGELTPLAGLAERMADGMSSWSDRFGEKSLQEIREDRIRAIAVHLEPIGEVLRECREAMECVIAVYDLHDGSTGYLENLITRLDALLGTKGGE